MKTLPELAQEALDTQNASNLAGLATTFTRVVADIRKIYPTNQVWQRHPIIKVWLDKMTSLSGMQTDINYSHEYQQCMDMAATVSQ